MPFTKKYPSFVKRGVFFSIYYGSVSPAVILEPFALHVDNALLTCAGLAGIEKIAALAIELLYYLLEQLLKPVLPSPSLFWLQINGASLDLVFIRPVKALHFRVHLPLPILDDQGRLHLQISLGALFPFR